MIGMQFRKLSAIINSAEPCPQCGSHQCTVLHLNLFSLLSGKKYEILR
jgi:hypothetical protein